MMHRYRLTLCLILVGVCRGFSIPGSFSWRSPISPFNSAWSMPTVLSATTATTTTTSTSHQDMTVGISAIDNANDEIIARLDRLRHIPAFCLFGMDILSSCEYMPQELQECYTSTCEVYPVEDDTVPPSIKEIDLRECDITLDGWARWDMPGNDYYNMDEFPEGYTGYDGSMIWEYIHERICFNDYKFEDHHWKADFNKAVSGIHSVVSAQVIRGIQEKRESGEEFLEDEPWRDPKDEFERRLSPDGETPSAINNLYFTYMLFLSAVAKIKNEISKNYLPIILDKEAEPEFNAFLELPIFTDPSIQSACNTLREHAMEFGDDLWEGRMRTRELLRIMNCVQCNKCRLHGKVAMMGLSTAFKIHLDKTLQAEDSSRIRRVELAALMATTFKCARAVQFCKEMA